MCPIPPSLSRRTRAEAVTLHPQHVRLSMRQQTQSSQQQQQQDEQQQQQSQQQQEEEQNNHDDSDDDTSISSSELDEPSLPLITEPEMYDVVVVVVRSDDDNNSNHNHIRYNTLRHRQRRGNRHLHALCRSFVQAFADLSSSQTHLVSQIWQCIQAKQGRFLLSMNNNNNNAQNEWIELDEEAALQAIGQTLRDLPMSCRRSKPPRASTVRPSSTTAKSSVFRQTQKSLLERQRFIFRQLLSTVNAA